MNDDFFKNLTEKDTSKESNYDYSIAIEKNINFFITLAKIVKIVFFVLAFLLVIISIVATVESTSLFIYLLITAIVFFILAIIIPPFLEWKALTLKNINEIKNNQLKGKK